MIDSDYPRLRIGAMIAQGFAVDAVRDGLNLKGASEVWGGPEFDHRPAWYFWLTTAPGAYQLRLEHVEPIELALRCILSVKYYPSKFEPVFDCFGSEERKLIRSGYFDQSNTPAFEAQKWISQILFTVGRIDFLHDPGDGQTLLSFSAFDGIRRTDDFNDKIMPGTCDVEPPAAIAGELPAWDIGYPLFESLVGLETFLARKGPGRVILFERSDSADERIEYRKDTAPEYKTILTMFGPDTPVGSPLGNEVVARLTKGPAKIVYDLDVRGHQRHRDMVEAPTTLSDQWWVLADDDQYSATMPCSCR